jgi:hypothetical protein
MAMEYVENALSKFVNRKVIVAIRIQGDSLSLIKATLGTSSKFGVSIRVNDEVGRFFPGNDLFVPMSSIAYIQLDDAK